MLDCGEGAVKVRDQVFRIFEPDGEADAQPVFLAPACLRPSARAADARGVEGQGKAFEPAPAVADAEQLQRVDEGRALFAGVTGQHEAEQTAPAAEIARPQFMAGRPFHHRAQHMRNLGAGFEPVRDLQRAGGALPDRGRPDPADLRRAGADPSRQPG